MNRCARLCLKCVLNKVAKATGYKRKNLSTNSWNQTNWTQKSKTETDLSLITYEQKLTEDKIFNEKKKKKELLWVLGKDVLELILKLWSIKTEIAKLDFTEIENICFGKDPH